MKKITPKLPTIKQSKRRARRGLALLLAFAIVLSATPQSFT